jgi:hypothetical protein
MRQSRLMSLVEAVASIRVELFRAVRAIEPADVETA